MADPIIEETRVTKVLMDEGNGLNILYAETLDRMGIDGGHLRPCGSPFHGVVSGMQATLIGKIDQSITFRTVPNFRT